MRKINRTFKLEMEQVFFAFDDYIYEVDMSFSNLTELKLWNVVLQKTNTIIASELVQT